MLAPISHASVFRIWKKLWGVKEFLGSSSTLRRLREAWKKRRILRGTLGRLFGIFTAAVRNL